MRTLVLALVPLVLAFSGCGAGSPPSQTGSAAVAAGAPSGLAYSASRAVYNAGRAIAPNTATVSGLGIAFSVAPPLPAGLVLDPATGTISGTPTSIEPTARYVVTAANSAGSTSFALFVTVVDFALAFEPNQHGEADSVRVLGAAWGRLVDVWSRDGATAETPRARNVLVDENVVATSGSYRLATNVATGGQRLVIDAPFGSAAFADAFDAARASLVSIPDKGLSDLPPFGVVARNSTLVLRFDDLIDPATITTDTVKLFVGLPPIEPFEMRVFADPGHGGVADRDHDGVLETYSTRILVDLATTDLEAAASSPPIAINWLGLPGAASAGAANAVVRLPTRTDPPTGQFTIVRNLAGNPISFTASGPNDPASPTHDVLRAFRSGGDTAVVGDIYNGFLRDETPPRVVVERAGTVAGVGQDFALGRSGVHFSFAFASPACASRLLVGDTVAVGGVYAEVAQTTAAPSGAGTIAIVRARILTRGSLVAGAAQVDARFDSSEHLAACAVRFTPELLGPASAGALPEVTVTVRLDEPVGESSIRPNENLRIARVTNPVNASDVVPCASIVSVDSRAATLVPALPLAHVVGSTEAYYFAAGAGTPLADLAGNALASPLEVAFYLYGPAPAQSTDGFVLRFDSSDELFNDGLPELRGAFLHDFAQSRIVPRPVVRFEAVADRTQPVPSVMSPYPTGSQTPLSRLGSKLQALWRYCDVGFALLDEQNYDVDVEGIAWAPVGGAAIADHYARFEMSLSHTRRLPDEALDGVSLLPRFPSSGVQATYATNVLDPVNDPQKTVHPGAHGHPGYTVNPADAFVSSTGTVMMPFPLNRGIPPSQREFYTWRDTSLRARGGTNDSPGVELPIVSQVTGTPPVTYYAAGAVPTFGLPLLMEYRCYPDSGALGLNAFDVSLAAASSARPAFRAFSTGGVNSAGQTILVDPDLANVATGGFNPNSTPPGQATLGVENTFYIGELDLVTRVSRVHTIWFDSGSAAPAYVSPSLAPSPAQQPAGTSVRLDFRGATQVTNVLLRTDATTIDPYGDRGLGVGGADPVFLNGDASWHAPIGTVNGARFFQVRATLVSNAETLLRPSIDTLGFAWRR